MPGNIWRNIGVLVTAVAVMAIVGGGLLVVTALILMLTGEPAW